MAMEFWGVEVKAGEPLSVEPEEGFLIHLSQASLGEVKKDKNDSVLVSVNINGKKIVLGTLSSEKCPQISYDLVFEKEFELSHNWKNGSVYFCGYKAEIQEEGSDVDSDMFESEEEDEPIVATENGKVEVKAEKPKAPIEKAKADKPNSSAAKKVTDAKPVSKDSDDSDEDDSDDDSEEDSDGDEEMVSGVNDDDSSDEEDDSSDEDDDTPKNVKENKKRPGESANKTPVPEKKAKLVTPQKSGGDGKKGGNAHTATPHPSKQAGKAKAEKSKSPKPAGQIACKSCSKTFNSDGALQSHTKAKHSEAK